MRSLVLRTWQTRTRPLGAPITTANCRSWPLLAIIHTSNLWSGSRTDPVLQARLLESLRERADFGGIVSLILSEVTEFS